MKISKHIKSKEQAFFAVFTDWLENVSTDYTADDIQKLLAQADEKGWLVKFFCRDEDNLFYKQHLGIKDSQIMSMCLNEAGFKVMENEITYCLRQMVNTQNN